MKRKTRFEVDGWWKDSEEDVYEKGCIPGSGNVFDGNERFVSDTVTGLIEKLSNLCGLDALSVLTIRNPRGAACQNEDNREN